MPYSLAKAHLGEAVAANPEKTQATRFCVPDLATDQPQEGRTDTGQVFQFKGIQHELNQQVKTSSRTQQINANK